MDDFNMNNNNDENKKSMKSEMLKSKWINFTRNLVNKEGFYLVLFICICIVATTAVWVSRQNVDKYNEMITENDEFNILEDVEDIFNTDSSVTILDDNENLPDVIDDKKENEINEQTSSITDEPAKEATQEEVVVDSLTEEMLAEEAIDVSYEVSRDDLLNEIDLPVRGTISTEYAMDKLVYSETLDQWTTHNGLDISSVAGSEVKSILDGIVTNIENSEELGISIIIDHGAGITSKYSGLSTSDMVEIGQRVTKDQTISGIGNSVGFELMEGSHLHFELLIDGENVNPTLYLPTIK